MKYYAIDPKDTRYDNYVLFKDDADERLVVRDSYRHLQCRQCRKIDETAALELPLESDLKMSGPFEMHETHDGIYYCNARVRDIFDDRGISGVRFVQLPGDHTHSLMLPTVQSPVDRSVPGYEFVPPQCSVCGRFSEVYGFARLSALTVPEDPLTVFVPEIWLEDSRSRITTLLISENVMSILKAERISGIAFSELAQSWPNP